MRIEISGRKYQIDEELRDYILTKASKLNRYFGDEIIARVFCKEERGKAKLEMTILFGDTIIRCEETSEGMYKNVDVIIPKIDRQIRKYRTKIEKESKIKIGAYAPIESEEEIIEEEDVPQIVRKKKFMLSPMTEDEAILQLELVSNSFYIFLNADTNKVCVIYKRDDGNVGLIEVDR